MLLIHRTGRAPFRPFGHDDVFLGGFYIQQSSLSEGLDKRFLLQTDKTIKKAQGHVSIISSGRTFLEAFLRVFAGRVEHDFMPGAEDILVQYFIRFIEVEFM